MKTRYRNMVKRMEVREKEAPSPTGTETETNAAVWSLYILQCGDGSFYTGVTTDIDRRFRQHQAGRASRYTRTHQPVALVYREECGTRSRALSRECAVKALGRQAKIDLIAGKAAGKNEGRTKRRTGRKKTG